MDEESPFAQIYAVVRRIPLGQVASYGQVASECGATARTAGWAMAQAPECGDDGVPWHRVVGADGYLRIGRRSVELQSLQRALLDAEGVAFTSGATVDMTRHRFEFE